MLRAQTALHLAVLTDQPGIVRRLLDCGASPNVVDSRGQTCLHTAVLLDSTACLRQLLRRSRRSLGINALSCDGIYFYICVFGLFITDTAHAQGLWPAAIQPCVTLVCRLVVSTRDVIHAVT